jgi:hypothetical protein
MRDEIQNKKEIDLVKTSHSKIVDPLDFIELEPQQIAGALTQATTGAIASSIPVINKLFEWAERVDQASREKKLKILFNKYSTHFQSIDDAVSNLKLLTATRGGQTIFRKIIQIISKGPEDQEWINLLAVVLRRISGAEFEKYFESQMFILSQIDRLTSQALIILAQYDIWKDVTIQKTTTTSGQTMGDWAPQVTMFMRQKTGINNLEVGGRINHSFRELESSGMITLSGHRLKLTAIGLEIYRTLV